MAYPLNPTEFPTAPTGSINAPERLRFALFGFTAEAAGGVYAPGPGIANTGAKQTSLHLSAGLRIGL